GKHADAERSLTEALKVRTDLLLREPKNVRIQLDAGASGAALARLFWDRGRPADAQRHWKAALELLDPAAPAAPDDKLAQRQVVDLEMLMVGAHGEMGLWDRAAEFCKRSLVRKRTTQPMHDARMGIMLVALGEFDAHRDYCRLLLGKWRKV